MDLKSVDLGSRQQRFCSFWSKNTRFSWGEKAPLAYLVMINPLFSHYRVYSSFFFCSVSFWILICSSNSFIFLFSSSYFAISSYLCFSLYSLYCYSFSLSYFLSIYFFYSVSYASGLLSGPFSCSFSLFF